jgi:hypothetical protein
MWEAVGNENDVKAGIKVLKSAPTDVEKSEVGRITVRQIRFMSVFFT